MPSIFGQFELIVSPRKKVSHCALKHGFVNN